VVIALEHIQGYRPKRYLDHVNKQEVTNPLVARATLTSQSAPSYDLREVYEEATRELKIRKDNGHLTEADFDLITHATGIQDLMAQVRGIIVDRQQHIKGRRVLAIGDSLLKKLQGFGSAIDMLVQSVPDILDMGLVGLLWGSLRFFLLVRVPPALQH